MPLTQEQLFKTGFLLKCAEAGLTIAETNKCIKNLLELHSLCTKQAGVLGTLGTGLGWTGLGLGIGLPVLAGGTTGLLAAKATSPDQDIVADAKREEIMGEYERLAEEARRRARLKRLQQGTGRRVVALTPDTAV